LRYRDVEFAWQDLIVPAGALAFTWCQVPILYRLKDEQGPAVSVTRDDGSTESLTHPALPPSLSAELFRRSGRIRQIALNFSPDMLYVE
jgi:hypothetical protein